MNRMRRRTSAFVGFCLLAAHAATVHAQGSVTSVAVSPRTIVAGGTVSVTATGTNPCGAARINYGDGDAITYALTGLPVTQTHVYQKAGNYTITAEGMGNCAGAPTTTLVVSAPPPRPEAPPARSAITIEHVEITPRPARVHESVAVIARGRGACAYQVEYGDGTSQQVNARLPEDSHHTYAKPGRYVIVVRPTAPCVGKFTEVLEVAEGTARPGDRITHVLAYPSPGTAGRAVAIAVHGSGRCAYDIYYGDGTAEDVNGPLPSRTRHVYERPGRYAVVVKPQPPCSGDITEMLQVRDAATPTPQGPQIARVTAVPAPAAARQPVTLTIDGSGACAFTIDYGDGNSDRESTTLPASVRHVYSAPGFYTVVVIPNDSQCTGSGRVSFRVRRSGR
jgi:PKD repeat protein